MVNKRLSAATAPWTRRPRQWPRWPALTRSRADLALGLTPAWASVPSDIGGASLLLAQFGLVWDVAYHIDHGRDLALLTPAHVVILVGLTGLGLAAALSVSLATVAGARSGLRLGPLRVPHAALALGAMAGGALAAFPLDDLWHRTYGIDVTLWSPTHLTMIGGAVLSTFALPLFAVEAGVPLSAGPGPLWRRRLLLGGFLMALSVFQLEFDFGVPQWQLLYQPLLVAITAGIGLTAARAALGPGAALWAAFWFLLVRALLALAVGPGLGHTVPRFPLYLGSALAVEAAFRLLARRGPATTAVVAGVLVGTAGLATEWGWSHAWGVLPWTASMLPRMWAPFAAAVLAALVGMTLGRVLAGGRPDLPAWALVGSLLGLAFLLAVPLPRQGVPVSGTVWATPAGPERTTTDRLGLPALERDVEVEVALRPADAAAGADWFEVLAWQGGGRRMVPLVEESPGRYRATAAVPTGGSWKAIVYLARGSEMGALPISLPTDPQYGSQGLPVAPVRSGPFLTSQALLMTEAHGGPPGVAAAAYAAMVGLWTLWIGLLLSAAGAASRRAAARNRG